MKSANHASRARVVHSVRILLMVIAAALAAAVPAGAADPEPKTPPSRTPISAYPDLGSTVPAEALPGPDPAILLSWHGPFGMPGSASEVTAACNDTTQSDTLYLMVDPGRPISGPLAMEAVLLFHAPPGDTLEPFWFFKRNWDNNGGLVVDFDRLAGFPCEVPWPLRPLGNGRVSYDHRSGRGRLDLSFVAPATGGSGISPDVRYCVARVVIKQKRPWLAGCRQPVCIEFASLRLAPRFGPDIVITRGEHRFATWNSGPGGCASSRRNGTVRAWRPGVPTGSTPATWDLDHILRDVTQKGHEH